MNQPRKKDVDGLLAQACHVDFRSYSTNEEWLSREQVAEVYEKVGANIPDFAWNIQEVLVSRDRVIVQGQATGTPIGDFWGAPPTGKSFNTMAVDVYTVRGDKFAMAYHVENWLAALRQIRR